ncbi:MAG TPA: PQQ-binding-like beta-propeller repeat protein, partial [Novosphingobium sp.]|nr:PQQ-binding-like beta-propeller repeat protein [Novosphingobium sp.]
TYDARRGLLYFGSGENYSSPADGNSDAIFAVEARTGRLVWRTQLTKGDAWNVGCMLALESCPQENGPDYDLSASALLIDLGGGRDILVLGQKSGWAYGVAPDSGAILWRRQLGHGGTQGGVHFGMAAEGTRIFAPVNDMANTYDGRHYDPALRGAGLHALDAATGRPFWFAKAADRCAGKPFCDPGISAAATAMPGVVFAGHLDGMLRAYDAASGALLWQADTTAPVTGVDGRQGHGGSMSGPGPAIWQGLVIANSGYGMYSHMAGNVLLVYAAGGS